MNGPQWADQLTQDIRYAIRSLRLAPGLTITVVGTLAISIGLFTTFFSFLNTVRFRALPYADSDRIVQIGYGYPVAPSAIEDLRQSAKSFEWIAAFVERTHIASGESGPAEIYVVSVDTNVFPGLKARPIVGRWPSGGEIRAGAMIVVIGEDLWQSRFNRRPDILSQQLTIDSSPRQIIGVMPRNFSFHNRGEAWIPLWGPNYNPTDLVSAIAKLARGATRDAAFRETALAAARLKAFDPVHYRFGSPHGISGAMVGRGERWGSYMDMLWTVIWATLCVLLVACVNVALLMLARGARRRGEMVVRASLGASRWQLVRQQVVESVILAGAAGAVGTLMSVWAIRLLIGTLPDDTFASWIKFGVDGRVLAVAVAASLSTVGIFGLWPALAGTRFDLAGILKSDAGHAIAGADVTRSADIPVVLQLTLSLLLFIAAVVFTQSYRRMTSYDRGHSTSGLTETRLGFDPVHDTSAPDQTRIFRLLSDRMPTGAIASTTGRFYGFPGVKNSDGEVYIPGTSRALLPTFYWHGATVVSPNYFQTMGVRVLAGRTFSTSDDRGGATVAVVSLKFARAVWATTDVLGRQLVIGSHGQTATVIGIVSDQRVTASLDQQMSIIEVPDLYLSDRQALFKFGSLMVRSRLPVPAIKKLIESNLVSLGHDRPADVWDVAEREVARATPQRFFALIVGVIALVGFLLAVVGIYGMVAFRVEQRTRELGIRVALGAHPGDIVRLAMASATRLAAVGLGIGLLAALAGARVIGALVLGTTGTYLGMAVAVAAGFGAVASLSCYLPARRAARLDPVIALRS